MDRWMRPFLLIISGLSHLQSSVNMMNSSWSFISPPVTAGHSSSLSRWTKMLDLDWFLRFLRVCED